VDERDVAEVLRDLPRIGPSDGFSERVLRKARSGGRTPRAGRWRAPVLIAAAAVAALGIAGEQRRRRERALRDETRSIARELEGMKRALPSPMIDLGKKDGVRYVLDLRRVPAPRGGIL